jgi:integrase
VSSQIAVEEMVMAGRMNAYERRVDGTISRKRARGRPRKLVSLGRYPWIPYTRAYMEAVHGFYGPRTEAVVQRGLARLGKILQELKQANRVTTTNPKKLKLEDIRALLVWMNTYSAKNGRPLRPATKEHYFGFLINLLRWVGNPVLDEIKTPSFMRFPRKVPTEVSSLSEEALLHIRSALSDMPGWEGSVARFMVSMYAYSGMRRSELRLARIQDLDTRNWRIVVVHPKGDGVWASAGTALILRPARPDILRFIVERKEYLAYHDVSECEPLVPKAWCGGIVEYWSDAMWGKMKADAEEWAGTRFRIQDLRATFAQMCMDRGASIESVSRALRHRCSRTTELYYARIRPEKAFQELEGLF